jgi:hypothetical protein
MQQTLLKQWQDFNRLSVAFYKESSGSQAAVINNWINLQWDSASWAKLARSSLDSFKAMSEVNEAMLNGLWQRQLGKLDLNDLAAALRELNEITASFVTTLVQNQVPMWNLFTEATAKYLEVLKGAKSVEDVITAQAPVFTEIQEKFKTTSLETLQTLGAVRSALTAWTERTIDNAAEQEESAPPAASLKKRAAST